MPVVTHCLVIDVSITLSASWHIGFETPPSLVLMMMKGKAIALLLKKIWEAPNNSGCQKDDLEEDPC